MGREKIRRVAIVGSGPTGSALATWLRRGGIDVVMFTRGKRPPIIVGESLVPAVVPYLRDLGIEDEVAKYSMYKPGATWVFHPIAELSFRFAEARGAKTAYAYNVPRDRFDQSLLDVALRAGALKLDQSVRLEREPGSDRIRLDPDAQAAATQTLCGPPDFIVDATGRARTVARLMELETVEGPRKDTALHAHCAGVELVLPGNIHSERMERGWGWRIPLPGCVSVGFVIPSDHLAKFGSSAEEQFDTFIRKDMSASRWGAKAERLTPVVRYSNYQLRATRGSGENWALVGDSFGFVDPVFSSGLLIGLDGAKTLAAALLAGAPAAKMRRYEKRTMRLLDDWTRIVEGYYSGRLFTLFRVGKYVESTRLGRIMSLYFGKHMPRVFTGEATDSRYSMGVVDFMLKHGLAGNDPEEFRVR
jgi:flavin-dependent dehydrogenase